jgi:Predicted integral membrane protein (DUF2269)
MWSWFTFWLLLHVLTAIAAFGPSFAFPFISRFAQRDPRNALVVSEILHGIEGRITIPAAVVMPFFGLALIYAAHIDLWKSEWLVISIVLYIIAFFLSAFVQLRNATKMIDLLKSMPAPPGPGAVAPVAGGAQGPPPEVAALARRLSMGGTLLMVLLVAIIVLMVWRPGGAFTG